MKFAIGMLLRNTKTNEKGEIIEQPVDRDGLIYYPVAVYKDSYDPPVLGSDRVSEWPEHDVELSK